jgi:transposase-like protein
MDLNNPIFKDDNKAREHLEWLRWGSGRNCPHCGEAEKTSPVAGTSHLRGLYCCRSCKSTFTVTVGTLCCDPTELFPVLSQIRARLAH